MKNLLSFLLFTILLFCTSDISAQGWKKTYGTSGNELGLMSVETMDGGFLVLCSTSPNTNISGRYLMKVNTEGIVEWRDTLDDFAGNRLKKMTNGDFMLFGLNEAGTYKRPTLIRYDNMGTELWTQEYRDTIDVGPTFFRALAPHDFVELPNGNILFHTNYQINSASIYQGLLVQTDPQGNQLSEVTYNIESDYGAYNFHLTSDGFILISDITASGTSWIRKIEDTGNIFWQNDYGAGGISALATDETGGAVFSDLAADPYLRIDNAGTILWSEPNFNLITFPHSAVRLPDDTYVFTGDIPSNNNNTGDRHFFLKKIDASGNLIWLRVYPQPNNQLANHLLATSDGGFLLTGYDRSQTSGDDYNIHLIKTDSLGRAENNLVIGNVFIDENGNCTNEPNETPLNNYYLEAEGASQSYTVSSDTLPFQLGVEDGSHDIYLHTYGPYWEICSQNPISITSAPFDTSEISFIVQSSVDCPYLEVDISTPRLRRCFPNVYYVRYSNQGGTQAATDAYIEVSFDEFTTVDSASIPMTTVDNVTYTFEIGTIEIGEIGDFLIYTHLDCDETILGQNHCAEAHIYPDTSCLLPSTAWSGADIELSAQCDADSLRFQIQNVGTGNMQGPLQYLVIEDEVILLQGSFNLNIGGSRIIPVPANGSTFRMETQQEPFHPMPSNLSLTVEGCGLNDNNAISLGFVNLFPDNDELPFMSVECRNNSGSFDPNDKQGFPIGYAAEHYIEPNTELEYMIRFQNTGTDTAFRVVIVDTLSSLLNPLTIRTGASSHDYDWNLSGENVLTFTFDPIFLPDSNVNVAASQGFVQFTIAQNADNPLTAVIKNTAEIYFDFNDPVVTNTTFHTLGEMFILVQTEEVLVPGLQLDVFPNPFRAQTTFQLKGKAIGDYTLVLYDLQGRRIRQEKFNTDQQLHFMREALLDGLYFYTIEDRAQVIASGKLMVF